MSSVPGDAFSNAAAYEAFVGRWSRRLATPFLDWLRIEAGREWLDVGAGTGILTQAILDQMAPKRVVGIDRSEGYLAAARQTIRDERVAFQVADAATFTADKPTFDVAVAGLVLNFVTAPDAAMQGMKAAVRPGGTIAGTVWDYGDRMEMMRHFWKAAKAVDPAASQFDSGTQFPLSHPDRLRALFETAGLNHVEVRPIDLPTTFTSLDDFWTPFLGAQGSVARYLRAAGDDTKTAIREQLRGQLPVQSDGSIPLTARAWAIKGTR